MRKKSAWAVAVGGASVVSPAAAMLATSSSAAKSRSATSNSHLTLSGVGTIWPRISPRSNAVVWMLMYTLPAHSSPMLVVSFLVLPPSLGAKDSSASSHIPVMRPVPGVSSKSPSSNAGGPKMLSRCTVEFLPKAALCRCILVRSSAVVARVWTSSVSRPSRSISYCSLSPPVLNLRPAVPVAWLPVPPPIWVPSRAAVKSSWPG